MDIQIEEILRSCGVAQERDVRYIKAFRQVEYIPNAMRRILEHYFMFFGGVTPENAIEKFDGQDKMICGSLFSWINDGSHFANYDLYMCCDPSQIDRYLTVFRLIFDFSGHEGHYRMMMGNEYITLSAVVEEPENPPVIANDSVAEPASLKSGTSLG